VRISLLPAANMDAGNRLDIADLGISHHEAEPTLPG
jgi:hypothetical protein